MDIAKALAISARGMEGQTSRLHVIAEGLCNRDGTASTRERDAGARRQDPVMRTRHPSAQMAAQGGMRAPNLGSFAAAGDACRISQADDAALGVLEATRDLLNRTIALLR